jgi:two-component system OmpR family sensor kinase
MRSVRRTLLVTLLAAVAAVTSIAALLVYRSARREIDAIFDYHLRQMALTLRDEVPRQNEPGVGAGDYDFVIQIWTPDGVRLYLSDPGNVPPASTEPGFATIQAGGTRWRVYSTLLAGLVVQVAQPLRVRQDLAFAAALRTFAPVLVILPLLAILGWSIVGRALAPLERLAGSIGSRTPAALDPIGESGVPEEALPLVRSINDLLGRLASALGAQRAFVADAAHELRTPLAALKLQAQLVERAGSPAERAMAMADLHAGLERATRLVQQLLALARAEPDAASSVEFEPVKLAELVAQTVADHALVAEARRIDLGATGAGPNEVVRGELPSLRTLLANLVDNAIRYTPEGGRVDVSTGVAEGRPFLQVTDSGPGIPSEERERVFDRFHRPSGTPGSGSGLGLAIVKAIARRHGATVALQDAAGGGLAVRVVFPGELRESAARAGPSRAAGGATAPP